MVSCERQDIIDLPEVVVESQYIEYSTAADVTVVCMDDFLSGRDRYIAETAAFLGIAPPTQKFRFIWIPESLRTAENWLCNSPIPSAGCQKWLNGENIAFTTNIEDHHEFVHAISIGEFGRTHPLLEEGLAEYLGSFRSSHLIVDNFPAKFEAMLDRGVIPDQYSLAMHYVGSVLSWHGIENFKTLMQRLPRDGGFEALAKAHKDVYGESLDEALARMNAAVVGRVPTTCDGEPIPWEGGDDLEVTLKGVCGDGRLFGPGFVAGYPAFYKEYMIEVPANGVYGMRVSNVGDTGALASAGIRNCPGVEEGLISALNGSSGVGRVYQGPHRLGIGFPHGPEAKGEVVVTLTYQGDPDAAPLGDETVVLRPLD